MRNVLVGTAVATMVIALAAGVCVAQNEEARITADYQNEPLSQVLEMLKGGWNLNYTLDEGVDPNLPVTAHLRGMTVSQALKIILEPMGLMAVDQDGRYTIKERPMPAEREMEALPVTGSEGRVRTPPTRAVPSGTAARGEAAGEEEDEEEKTILDIVWPRYLDAGEAAMIFGGSVWGGGMQQGGYGGSSGYGGYGGSSGYGGYGGSSGYGGYGGSSGYGGYGGSSFGSNRSFGSSNRSFGSNRSSSLNRSTSRNY